MRLSPGMFVRSPAVAGLFYPQDPTALHHQVHGLLQDAALVCRAATSPAGRFMPTALIVPHAGYAYSGPTAAAGFAALMNHAAGVPYHRVLLIGPAHRVPVRGLAASSAGAFATPLGQVPVDPPGMQWLFEQPEVTPQDQAHQPEHALEVELPFLQEILPSFSILPLLLGQTSAAQVARVLRHFARDGRTLIVVSSDLSHYLSDQEARRRDAITAAKIQALQADALQPADACGHTAIAGLLRLARESGWNCTPLDLRNSGAAPGADKHRVVGYGAWMFARP